MESAYLNLTFSNIMHSDLSPEDTQPNRRRSRIHRHRRPRGTNQKGNINKFMRNRERRLLTPKDLPKLPSKPRKIRSSFHPSFIKRSIHSKPPKPSCPEHYLAHWGPTKRHSSTRWRWTCLHRRPGEYSIEVEWPAVITLMQIATLMLTKMSMFYSIRPQICCRSWILTRRFQSVFRFLSRSKTSWILNFMVLHFS